MKGNVYMRQLILRAASSTLGTYLAPTDSVGLNLFTAIAFNNYSTDLYMQVYDHNNELSFGPGDKPLVVLGKVSPGTTVSVDFPLGLPLNKGFLLTLSTAPDSYGSAGLTTGWFCAVYGR